MDAKEYIKNKIKEYDPSIDTSKGSPIGDLFINPLSSILQSNLDFEETMLNNLSLKNEASMSADEIDSIIANFLIERNVGKKASGNIRLFYNFPVAVTIPINSIFETDDGRQYKTTQTFSLTSQFMLSNNDYFPLYHTGDIPIEAIAEGESYITSADTVTNLVSYISPEPTSIRNLLPITQGIDRETNTQLKTKAIESVNNKSIASASGIKRTLQDNFSTITALTIKSLTDTEMVRDITYSGIDAQTSTTIDFNSKISGMYAYPYNESIGYVGRFEDTDESTAIALPDPADFTYELTNTMYGGLFRKDDPMYAELTIYNILQENFAADTVTGYDATWVLSDGQINFNTLLDPNEISINDQAIKLGVKDEDIDKTYLLPSNVSLARINADAYNSAINILLKLIDENLLQQENENDIIGGGPS